MPPSFRGLSILIQPSQTEGSIGHGNCIVYCDLPHTFILYNGISCNPTSALVVIPIILSELALVNLLCLLNAPVLPIILSYEVDLSDLN